LPDSSGVSPKPDKSGNYRRCYRVSTVENVRFPKY
jgi:hypothetical protein